MTDINSYTNLSDICRRFIKARRNYVTKGDESKTMFSVTSPFTELEGFRFASVGNCKFDFLNYVPTLDHVFLEEATLQGFERYLDMMFSEADKLEDFSYFKILSKLDTELFQQFTDIVKTGCFSRQSANSEYRVPISLISVAEFHLIENCSSLYTVKTTNIPLERSNIRVRLNTYFHALITLLNCSEDDILEVLYRRGILPSKEFQLISTQKELTIGLKRYRSSGLQEKFEQRFTNLEQLVGLMKPKFAYPNSNLCQALQQVFAMHPLYFSHQQSLLVETTFINDGKGCLDRAVRSRKRKGLSEQTQILPKKSKLKNEDTISVQEENVLAAAMLQHVPDLYLEPKKEFLTVNIDRELTPAVIILGLSNEKIEVLSVEVGQKIDQE